MKKALMLLIIALLCCNVAIFGQDVGVDVVDDVNDVNSVDAVDDVVSDDPNPVVNQLLQSVNTSPSINTEPEPNSDPISDLEPASLATASLTSKPKIAVYVTGGKDVGENRALATYLLDAIAASGRYTAIERSDVFLAEVDSEHLKQRSGAIDDSQISRLGRQSGVRYVCVADITAALRGFQISARIIDVETAEVVTVGVSTSSLKTMNDLRGASADVAMSMLRKLYPEDYANVAVPEKQFRIGVRAAYNNSYVSRMSTTTYARGQYGEEIVEKHSGIKGFESSGVEFSLVAVVGITDHLSLNVSPGFVIRKPVVTDVDEVSEMAINVPVLLELRILNTPLRLLAGVHVDLPLNTEIDFKQNGAEEKGVTLEERTAADFGITGGASYRIVKNVSIDARGSMGLRGFDSIKDRYLFQAALGVSYLY